MVSLSIPEGQRPGSAPPMKPIHPLTVPREVTTLRCRLCHQEWDRYCPDGSAVSDADEEVSHLLDSGCGGSVVIVSTQVKIVPVSILELMSPSEDQGSRRDPVKK